MAYEKKLKWHRNSVPWREAMDYYFENPFVFETLNYLMYERTPKTLNLSLKFHR